ncbi:MAG: hypothetical protein K9L73_05390, partial [Spirochaetia bacterium]|nr:hypothetical protein [Spirochaetia bacterium]
ISLSGKEIFTLKLIIDRQPAHSSTLPAIILSDEKTREDFSLYPYTDHVTEADIAQERDRSDDLKSNIADPMFRRTALEAQLSVILTENKIHEGKIRELGYQLNEARVQRRIHDYINSNFSET